MSASALELGISPDSMEIDAALGEEICKNFTVYSDREVRVDMWDKWTSLESRNINDYISSAKEAGITVSMPKPVNVDGKKVRKVCMTFREEGIRNGVIVFEAEENGLAIGTWISANITGGSNVKTKLTGFSVASFAGRELMFFEGVFLVVLLLCLAILSYKMR